MLAAYYLHLLTSFVFKHYQVGIFKCEFIHFKEFIRARERKLHQLYIFIYKKRSKLSWILKTGMHLNLTIFLNHCYFLSFYNLLSTFTRTNLFLYKIKYMKWCNINSDGKWIFSGRAVCSQGHLMNPKWELILYLRVWSVWVWEYLIACTKK